MGWTSRYPWEDEDVPCRFDLVTITTPDPGLLADFWAAALHLRVVEHEDAGRWIALAEEGGTRRIGLQRGDTVQGSIHLDLVCTPGEFDKELRRLQGLGATEVLAPRREPYGRIANLLDPGGNAFDLVAHDTAV